MLFEESLINTSTQGLVFLIRKIKNQKKWTREEDELLIQLAEKYSEKNWKEISRRFIKKNSLQCFSRYKRIRPGIIKGSWKKDEDIRILELVSIYGKAWSKISKILGTRNGKQIRDRYINVLDPEIRKGKFTEEEDNTLIHLYHQHGPKWAAIAKYYPNRTADMVKNRFHSSIKKRLGINQSDPSKKICEKGVLEIQSNPNSNCYGSPYSLNKAITSASVKTIIKTEPKNEVQEIYSELLLHECKEDNNFDNDDKDRDVNINNFFYSFNNNPFDLIKMEDPIQLKEDLDWNFEEYFISN